MGAAEEEVHGHHHAARHADRRAGRHRGERLIAVDDPIATNRRHWALLVATTFLLVAVPLALIALVVGLGLWGAAAALVVAALVTALGWWTAAGVALRRSGARPAEVADHPRLHNLVKGLCAAHGVAMPGLYVIDETAVNAFSVGRSADHVSIAVTGGLLDAMSRVELEAVLAHELSRIKDDDVLVDTLAVTMPVTARLIHRALTRQREPQADLSAARMTRYPPALAAALTKLRDADSVVRAASWSTAHLWIAAPRPDEAGSHVPAADDGRFDAHLPLDDRIAAVQEL